MERMRELVNEQSCFKEPNWTANMWDLYKDEQKISTAEIQNKKWQYKNTSRGSLYEKAVQLPAVVNTALNTRIALKH